MAAGPRDFTACGPWYDGHVKAAALWVREQWAQPMVRYPAVLSIYLCVFAYAFGLLETTLLPVYEQLSRLTASLVSGLISLFSSHAASANRLIRFDGFALVVVAECLGTLEMVIFAAFVLAYPGDWRSKAWGLLLGPVIIYFFNLTRLLTLVLVGRHQPDHFDFFHIYFWQVTLVAIVAATWLGWLRLFARR